MDDHDPIVRYYPGTLESPEEITVTCTCGQWSFEDQAGAGGPCNTNWLPAFDDHTQEDHS